MEVGGLVLGAWVKGAGFTYSLFWFECGLPCASSFQIPRGGNCSHCSHCSHSPQDEGQAKKAAVPQRGKPLVLPVPKANGKAPSKQLQDFADDDVEASDDDDEEEEEEEEDSQEEEVEEEEEEEQIAAAAAAAANGAKVGQKRKAELVPAAKEQPAAKQQKQAAAVKQQTPTAKQKQEQDKKAQQQTLQQQPDKKKGQQQEKKVQPGDKKDGAAAAPAAGAAAGGKPKVREFPNGFVIEELKQGPSGAKLAKGGRRVFVKYVGRLKDGKVRVGGALRQCDSTHLNLSRK